LDNKQDSWRWWLGRLDLGMACLAEFPVLMQKMDSTSEDLIFNFLEAALQHSHMKVRQTALQLLLISFRICSSQPNGNLKIATFTAQLKPALRRDIEKRLEYVDSLDKYDKLGYKKDLCFDDIAEVKTSSSPVKPERVVERQEETDKGENGQMLFGIPVEEYFAEPSQELKQIRKGEEADRETIENDSSNSLFFFEPSTPHNSNLNLDCLIKMEKNYKHGTHWKKGPMLGCGAFSTCFSGFDLTTGSLIAVKQVHLIRNSFSQESKLIDEICAEIKIMEKLDHPNIVRYLNCELEENHLNIFLEYVAGGSISSLISKFGPFPQAVIKRYLKQILMGLSYLHSEGILHRDIKGANILVDGNGTIKLADFGASAKLKNLSTLTGEFKSVRGTPAFMAPEVIRGEGYGRKSDIWSLGAVALEMATGLPPWVEGKDDLANNPFAIMYRIASTKSLPKIPSFLSHEAVDFITLCLKRDQDERPNASELLDHPFLK